MQGNKRNILATNNVIYKAENACLFIIGKLYQKR